MSIKEEGINILTKVLSHFGKQYSKSRIAVVETNGYYETIMTSAFLNVLKECKRDVILWGINNDIYKQFGSFSMNIGCVVFPMPNNPSHSDRSSWYDFVSSHKIPVYSCYNGLIKAGNHKPFFPTSPEDVSWFNDNIGNEKPIIVVANNSDYVFSDKYTVLSYNCTIPGSTDISSLTLDRIKVCVDNASYIVYTSLSLVESLALCGSKACILKDQTPEQVTKVIDA